MNFFSWWLRVARATWQTDQNVSAPWFIPLLFAVATFVITFLRVEMALPLLIVATALNRYRFDFFSAGLRIEHFVFVGVALAWFIKTRAADAGEGKDKPLPQHFTRADVGEGKDKPLPQHFTRADILLGLYLALALVSSLLFAPILRESLKFFGLMLFGALLYWLIRAIAANLKEFTRGVWTLIAVGIASALFGIVAWLVFPFGINLGVQIYYLGNFTTHSPFGALFDSNTLGMYAMAATLLQVTLLLDSQFQKYRAVLIVGMLITLIAVALSLTRTAWVGLFFGLLLIVLCSPKRRWAIAIGGAALALAILALIANSALAGGGNALAEFSVARVLTSQSIFFRLDAYERAWNDFLSNPFLGNGANVFAQNYTSPAGARDWISNFFLMTLHDTGIIGLVILLAWLGWLAVETYRALKNSRGAARTMLLGLSIAYLALFVTYQATTVFWLGFNWVYLGLIASRRMRDEG